MAGHLERAVRLYRRSIRVHPTAEAHTFLGWTSSVTGRLEAVPFPFMSLGRIHLARGRFRDAQRELEGAVRAAPFDLEARRMLHAVRARPN